MSNKELVNDFCCELNFLKMRFEVGLDLTSLNSDDFKKSLGKVEYFKWSCNGEVSDFLLNKLGSSSKEVISSVDLSIKFPFSLSVELKKMKNLK